MADLRLVVARQLVWDKDAWRRPGMIALVIRGLQEIASDENESAENRAEAEMLTGKLRLEFRRTS